MKFLLFLLLMVMIAPISLASTLYGGSEIYIPYNGEKVEYQIIESSFGTEGITLSHNKDYVIVTAEENIKPDSIIIEVKTYDYIFISLMLLLIILSSNLLFISIFYVFKELKGGKTKNE